MRLICTAGVTASSDHMSRAFGISWSASSLKFCCTRVDDVSMTGDSPVTVTVSCSVATASSTFTVAVNAIAIWMFSRFSVLNPGSSNVREYVPGGSAGKRYNPSVPVTAVCTPISDGLAAVTVTPGRTAPLLSTTLPLMEPVVLAPPPCANAFGADTRQPAAHNASNTLLILPLLGGTSPVRTPMLQQTSK